MERSLPTLTENSRLVLIAGACLLLGGGLFYFFLLPEPPVLQSSLPVPVSVPDKNGSDLVQVQLSGDGVVQPGTFFMDSDSQVIDLIMKGGGLKEDAISEGIDFKQPLFEGLKLTIPSQSALQAVKEGAKTLTNEDLILFRQLRDREPQSDLISINDAGSWQLQALPGIGPVMAQRIIKHREEHGRFAEVEDLRNITGIGDVTYKQIQPLVTVR